MAKKLVFFIIFFFLAACAPTGEKIGASLHDAKPGGKVKGKIIAVADGDTVRVNFSDEKNVRVRILSIDTPELDADGWEGPQPFAEEAANRAEELLLHKELVFELSKNTPPYDRFDRLLANIWLDEHTLYQEIMLEEGLARLAYVYEPDTKYVNKILAPAEEKARKREKGIWSIENYVGKNGFQLDH